MFFKRQSSMFSIPKTSSGSLEAGAGELIASSSPKTVAVAAATTATATATATATTAYSEKHGSRQLTVLSVYTCYPDGVLLSPTLLDFSPLQQAEANSSCYLISSCSLATSLSKCYYVEQDVYDNFIRGKGEEVHRRRRTTVEVRGRNDSSSSISSSSGRRTIARKLSTTSMPDNLIDDRVVHSSNKLKRCRPESESESESSRLDAGNLRLQFSMEHEGALFNINCRIVEASNLTAMDTNGKSDPYVYAYPPSSTSPPSNRRRQILRAT